MTFTFGARSQQRLQGVHPDLVKLVNAALSKSKIDFSVTEGLRTIARQKQLVASGASQTLNSRHITGHAVDLGAYVGGKIRWDWPLYFDIAEAMREASIATGIPIEWGAAWGMNLANTESAHAANSAYVQARLAANMKPFADGPHFQLPWKEYPR